MKHFLDLSQIDKKELRSILDEAKRTAPLRAK
jgi:ornithine carbamoyltransferase